MTPTIEHVAAHWIAPWQAGRLLGVGTTRIGQLVAAGRLRAYRTPLGNLIDPDSVNALLAARRDQRSRIAGRSGAMP